MTIPDYQTLMLPLLKCLEDQQEHSLRQTQEHSLRQTIDALADHFDLTDGERKELLPSGQQAIFSNRVGWARTHLKKAGLLESNRRGYFRITPRGLDILKQNPAKIDRDLLEQFEGYRDFVTVRRERPAGHKASEEQPARTPEETIAGAFATLRDDLARDLLQQIKANPPSLFESIVVDLLVKMGYGGSREDAGKAIGKAGDEGIDGVISEDRLGLDVIYIQAKRWESTVGRPEIQKFAGALQGQRARKGIFITTSDFSQDAREYASRIDSKIVLIDGTELAQLMIDYNLGVTSQATYSIKKIDLDYFTEQ